jgi:hypothetical protein
MTANEVHLAYLTNAALEIRDSHMNSNGINRD